MRLRVNVVLSVALHALLIAGAAAVRWHGSSPADEPRVISARFAMIERRAPLPAAEPPAVPDPIEPARENPGPEPPKAAPAAPAAPAADVSPPAEPTSEPRDPARDEDLATRLRDAPRRAFLDLDSERERADSVRSFSFPGTLAEEQAARAAERLRRSERGLQQPLTVFDSSTKGRAGITEPFGNGQTIRWISDDCYQLLGVSNPFLLFPDFMAPVTLCGQPGPRDDLFATIKPSYLMDAEERAEADAAFRRREQLRRGTTGAVMPLAEP